jgi:hypothetical protein
MPSRSEILASLFPTEIFDISNLDLLIRNVADFILLLIINLLYSIFTLLFLIILL